jgi:signal transduction histidine kinase/CHASE3 domain sensor protein
MKLKSILNSSLYIRVLFVLSITMLFYISSITYKHTKALNESTRLLLHSYQVQYQLEHVLSIIKDAETGHYGYIITRNNSFLQPYRKAQDEVYNAYIKLKALTLENQQQQANLDVLLQLIYARLKYMALSLESIAQKTETKELMNDNMLAGKEVMDGIRKQINKMEDLEISYFNTHQEKYNQEVIFSPISTYLFAIFSLFVFILSFYKISKDLNILRKANKKLLISNESIRQAEIIGDFCVTQWNLSTQTLNYSDNLYRLLGCEPQSFEPSIEKYLQYVYPDDRANVGQVSDDPASLEKAGSRYYRIIRKDGELRYFTSLGKFISDSRSNLYIEIVKDITHLHLSNIALEERNRELEQSIKELESFNRVASHDLQEPLRKIQTFISRINDEERMKLSSPAQEYLSKVDVSAYKMRILIDDLLLFSRTNKSEKIFEKSDLNLLLENATQELIHEIEEKKAIIQKVQLPVLKVISFQIQQLLVNLIGNALKYSKPGVVPIIRIECEKLNPGHYPPFISGSRKHYYKISVSDNGLGFDQEYAEKIFILFHRLLNDSKYVGTGIGLSICKKIAENHNGYIIAEGKPGIGATFTIYLPA